MHAVLTLFFRPAVTEAQLIAAVCGGDYNQVLAVIDVCCPPRAATVTTEGLLDSLEGYHNEDIVLAAVRFVPFYSAC